MDTNPRYFEAEIQKTKVIMDELGFRPVRLDDITAGNYIVMVDVQRLCSQKTIPIKIGDGGISEVKLEMEPIQDHPNIKGRKVVYYRHLGGPVDRRNFGKRDFAPIEEILRDDYDPKVANSSEVRYFSRK